MYNFSHTLPLMFEYLLYVFTNINQNKVVLSISISITHWVATLVIEIIGAWIRWCLYHYVLSVNCTLWNQGGVMSGCDLVYTVLLIVYELKWLCAVPSCAVSVLETFWDLWINFVVWSYTPTGSARYMGAAVGIPTPSLTGWTEPTRMLKWELALEKNASNYNMFVPPTALKIHDMQVAEKWKHFRRAWSHYALATGISENAKLVQVAMLLIVIGEEAQEVFSMFSDWEHEGDDAKSSPYWGPLNNTANHAKHSVWVLPFQPSDPGLWGNVQPVPYSAAEDSGKLWFFTPSPQMKSCETG